MAPNAKRARSGRGHGARGAGASSEQPAPTRVKTQPSESPHTSTASASSGPPNINASYIAEVLEAVATILDKMPGIKSQDPITEASGGFIAPYDPAIYSQKWREAGPTGQMHYQCGINFFWQNSITTPLPGVPMYKQRVDELASQVKPGLLKYPLIIRSTWADGSALPKGDCNHLSPCEWVHAVLFKVASEINDGISEEALEKWRTTLLSTPAIFVRIDSDAAAFAEANSLRQEAVGYRRAVEHSARQLVYNIWALKLRKEAKDGKEASAQALAEFWQTSVRIAPGNEYLHKKSTFDSLHHVVQARVLDPRV